MSNCKNCGAELHSNAKFCHLCGTKVEAEAVAKPTIKKNVALKNADKYQYVDTTKFVNADFVMAVPPLNDDNKFLSRAFTKLVIADTPADLFDYFEADAIEHDYVNVFVMKGFVESTYSAKAGIDEKKQVYNSSAGKYETKTITNWFPVNGDHKYSGSVSAVFGPEEGSCLLDIFNDKVVEMAELYQKGLEYPVGMPIDPQPEHIKELEKLLKEDAQDDARKDVKNSYDRLDNFRASSAIRSREVTVYSIPICYFRFSYALSQYQKEKAFWVSAFDVPESTAAGNLPNGLTDIKKLVDEKLHFKITRPLVVNLASAAIILALYVISYCFHIPVLSTIALLLTYLAIGCGIAYFFIYRKKRKDMVTDLRVNAATQKQKKVFEIKKKFFGKEEDQE